MAQLTRLGLGGYSVAYLWPPSINYIDLAAAFTTEGDLTADVTKGVMVDLAIAFTTEGDLTANVTTTTITYDDFAGAFTTEGDLTGNFTTTLAASVDLAGAFTTEGDLTGLVATGSFVGGSKYGLGPYGLGPYSRLAPANEVTLPGSFVSQTTLTADLAVAPAGAGGWAPVEPCPPSMWTPVECDTPELVE
jgi:hypothetical protein